MIRQVKVIGSGLNAFAAAKAINQISPNAEIINLRKKVKPSFLYAKGGNFCEFITGSTHKLGLSGFYHGVTPLANISSIEYSLAMQALWPSFRSFSNEPNNIIVPYKPLRPSWGSIRNLKIQHVDELQLEYGDILCMSAVSNLVELSKYIGGQTFNLNEHLIFRIGQVDTNELLEVLEGCLYSHVRDGVVFKFIDVEYPRARLFFRPIHGDFEINTDFAALSTSILKYKQLLRIGKLKEALYNKYGLFSNSKFYAVYAQVPVDNLLSLYNSTVRINPAAEGLIPEVFRLLIENIHPIFRTYTAAENLNGNILSGIHFSYDRKFLNHLPFRVYDTSMCKDELAHPTVISSIETYNDIMINKI